MKGPGKVMAVSCTGCGARSSWFMYDDEFWEAGKAQGASAIVSRFGSDCESARAFILAAWVNLT